MFIVVAFMLFGFVAKAQPSGNISKAIFFKNKFGQGKVWDVQRTPVNPVAGQAWKISGLKAALDVNKATIDWGVGRYLMFVAEVDNANTANSLADDVDKTNTKYNISLKLFEHNGTLVKVISKWGNIIGIGTTSFMYEAEGKTGIFFYIYGTAAAKVFEYTPDVVKANKLSQLPDFSITFFGTVKFFNVSKGFGFIKDASSGKEYFVHVSGLINEIRENDDVSFQLEEGKKGLTAVNVKLL